MKQAVLTLCVALVALILAPAGPAHAKRVNKQTIELSQAQIASVQTQIEKYQQPIVIYMETQVRSKFSGKAVRSLKGNFDAEVPARLAASIATNKIRSVTMCIQKGALVIDDLPEE